MSADYFTAPNGASFLKFHVATCCNPRVNGEHALLRRILADSTGDEVVLDVGATESEFPLFSNTHQFHMFDPVFKEMSGVDYSKCVINKECAVDGGEWSLKEYCARQGVKDILFMKIDTDGWDLDVIRGVGQDLVDRTEHIQVEYDMNWLVNRKEFRPLFDPLKQGRTAYKISWDGLHKVDDFVDNHLYTNYLFSKRADLTIETREMDIEFLHDLWWEMDNDAIDKAVTNITSPFFRAEHMTSEGIVSTVRNYMSIYTHKLVINALKSLG